MNNKSKFQFTIELYSILRDLKRNLIVVIMAVLIGFMGIYIVGQSMYQPEYTSGATLIVSAKVDNSPSYSNLAISSDMAEVFANVFVQPSMKTKAAENLGMESFEGTISAKAVSNTNILELSVTSDSPEKAYNLINSVLEVYPEISDVVFENSYIAILRTPAMAKRPSNSFSNTNKLIVLMACSVLGVGGIIGLSILRDTVKTEADFNDKIDANLIGTIVHESKRSKNKKKKALIINESTFLSLKFTEGFLKIAAKIEYAKRRNGDKVFAITSVAENEGKSTTASNIAIALASRGNKVILFDLDEKKPALYKIFEQEYKEKSELGELLAGKISKHEYKFRRYRKSNLFLAINTKPHKNYQEWIDSGVVESVIASLKEKVDYIIIDTAPISADSSVTDIMKMADKTIVVARTDVVHTATLNDALLTIKEVGGNLFGCVLNDVYPEFSLFGQTGFDEGGYYYSRRYGYGRYGKFGKYGRDNTPDKLDRYGKYGNYGRFGDFLADETQEAKASSYESFKEEGELI